MPSARSLRRLHNPFRALLLAALLAGLLALAWHDVRDVDWGDVAENTLPSLFAVRITRRREEADDDGDLGPDLRQVDRGHVISAARPRMPSTRTSVGSSFSAASDGVAARASATKSHRLVSIS